MSYNFKFGKYWISELGAVCATPPYEIAERDGVLVDIPGKDGADYIDNGRYKNVDFSRKISMLTKNGFSAHEKAINIVDEFAYLYGYQDFEDSDHEGFVTQAKIENFDEVNRDMRALHSATIRFSRKPYWQQKSGFEPNTMDLTVESPETTLINPYKAESLPILRFTLRSISAGTDHIAFTVTNNGVASNFLYDVNRATYYGSAVLEIDCEKKTATVIRGTNKTLLGESSCPIFGVGENTIALTNYNTVYTKDIVTDVQITPRWRCL